MVSFSGVGSGLDLSSVVDSLVAAERTPIAGLTTRKNATNTQVSTLGDLITKMTALASKAKELDSSSELTTLKVASAKESRVTATVTGDAAPANYSIRVNALATTQSNKSNLFTTKDPVGIGNLGITVGTDTTINVAIDDTMSLDDIAIAINASEARVTASVVDDGTGYRLLVTGKDPGAKNAITFNEEVGVSLGLGSGVVRSASDAEVEIDGLTIKRDSNHISDLFPGLTLDLHSLSTAGEEDAIISVERDQNGLREKVQSFVDAYNDVAKVLYSQLHKDPSSTDQVSKSQLLGDSALRGLQRQLGNLTSGAYAHDGSNISFGSLGISLSADGSLSIDAAKFDQVTGADPTALSDLFAGGADSLTSRIAGIVSDYTKSGTGILVSKRDGLSSRIDDFDDQIAKIEDRATKLGDRMRSTFTALDQTVSALQTQQSQLMATLFGQAS